MTIHVTQDHVAAGESKNCGHCPVALALRGSTGYPWEASYYELMCYGTGLIIRTPSNVEQWMRDFDCGRIVEPFSFEIPDLP